MIYPKEYIIVHELAETMRSFADPQRLKIVRILASRTKESLNVTDVSKILGISQPAASQHIKILKSTGILNSIRDSNRILYTINYDYVYRFREVYEDLYAKAFTPCPHDLQCNACPDKRTCA